MYMFHAEKTWEEAAEEIGKVLKLDFVSTSFLVDETIDEEDMTDYDIDLRAKRIARKYVAWISDRDIGLQRGEDNDSWMGWNKDNPTYDWLSDGSKWSTEPDESGDGAD